MNSKSKILHIHLIMFAVWIILLTNHAYASGNPLDSIETTTTSLATSGKSVAKAIISIFFIIGVVIFVAKKGQVSVYSTIVIPLIGTALIYGVFKLVTWASTAINF